MYDNLEYYINSAKIHNFISKKLIKNILKKNCTIEEIDAYISALKNCRDFFKK